MTPARRASQRKACSAYRDKHNDRVRSCKMKIRYGITIDDYEIMLSAQGGVCAICRQPEKTGQRLAVDHDHETKAIRGLLCGRCNRTLGLLDEDPDRFRAAASYLEKT